MILFCWDCMPRILLLFIIARTEGRYTLWIWKRIGLLTWRRIFGNDLLLELGLRSFGVFRMEGGSGCPSGRIFRDDLSSGRKTNFMRIWGGGSCRMECMMWKSRRGARLLGHAHLDEGQFFTTTNTPALSLTWACRRKVRRVELVGDLLMLWLLLDIYEQDIIWIINVNLLDVLGDCADGLQLAC